ncbi:MAG: Sir2 family NAD-dependent protein deacetylase [Chloroflexota bacterium]|nr:Sir2 family NAD-dependent protein deacetylase [Chloroflexota bacterium]
MEERLVQAARLVAGSQHLVALVGAGLSVESGIPPFRGPGGLWTKVGDPSSHTPHPPVRCGPPRPFWRVAASSRVARAPAASAPAKDAVECVLCPPTYGAGTASLQGGHTACTGTWTLR